MIKKISSSKGFSLTEVLVSIIILGILFGFIISLIVTGLKSSKAVEQRYNALIQVDNILTEFSNKTGDFQEISDEYRRYHYDKFFNSKTDDETEWYIDVTIETNIDIQTITIYASVLEKEYIRKVGVSND